MSWEEHFSPEYLDEMTRASEILEMYKGSADPLGLTPEQRWTSDMSERYGARLGPLLADMPPICPLCRQIQGHAASCLTRLITEDRPDDELETEITQIGDPQRTFLLADGSRRSEPYPQPSWLRDDQE